MSDGRHHDRETIFESLKKRLQKAVADRDGWEYDDTWPDQVYAYYGGGTDEYDRPLQGDIIADVVDSAEGWLHARRGFELESDESFTDIDRAMSWVEEVQLG